MRILCATDLLVKSGPAVGRAGMLADELVADLSLVHVVKPPTSPSDLESEISLANAYMNVRTQPPLWRHRPPEVIVRAGEPSRIVVEVARRRRAGLVVLGARRSRGARSVLKGTIAERALRAREFATLIVRQNPRHEYRNVVLALDLTETSQSVIRGLESMGLTGAQPCTVVHAYETPYEEMLRYAGIGVSSVEEYLGGWRREHRAAVTDLLMAQSAMPWRYDVVLEEGRPSAAILRYIKKSDPDLLVIGTRGASGLHRALLGSTANEVLGRAHCDVLVMPGEAPLRGRLANGRPAGRSLKFGSLAGRTPPQTSARR